MARRKVHLHRRTLAPMRRQRPAVRSERAHDLTTELHCFVQLTPQVLGALPGSVWVHADATREVADERRLHNAIQLGPFGDGQAHHGALVKVPLT